MKAFAMTFAIAVGFLTLHTCAWVVVGEGSRQLLNGRTQTHTKLTSAKKMASPKQKSATATLIVTSKPKGSTVSIYGSTIKPKHTPATFTGIKPGKWYLCADEDGADNSKYIQTYYKSVTLKAGKTTTVTIDFNQEDDGPPEGDGGPGTPTPMDKLISAIPYRTKHFTVSDAPNPARYDVMIIPHVRYPNDDSVKLTPKEYFAKNWKQCEQYGKEALRWIQSKGVNLKDLRICWLDDEWWPPGKTIKL